MEGRLSAMPWTIGCCCCCVGGGWDAVALNGGGWGPVDEAALDVVAGVGLSDGDLYPVYLGAVAGVLSKGD